MIEVAELSEATEPRTPSELYELLISHIGRTVRVRQAYSRSISLKPEAGGPYSEVESVGVLDASARLVAAHLEATRVPGRQILGDELTVSLEAADGLDRIDLDTARLELEIQVLIPGRGGWSVVHQSEGWKALFSMEEISE